MPGLEGPRRMLTRLRGVPADTAALWCLAGLTVLALVGFFARVTYPNYDSYYALIWGQEILRGDLPSFEAYRAPTEHPLWVVLGALMSLFGEHGDRVLVLFTVMSFLALIAGAYRLGRLCYTPAVGFVAAFLILTRLDFGSLAARGYIDIPFMATVTWAGALEAAKPKRGTPVFLLLVAAGLMRPEAWLLAGVYFLWMSWHATWPERFKYAALAAAAPLGWVATDYVVTGKLLFSLTSTQDLATELQRTRSGGDVITALPQLLRGIVKTPVFFAGLAGLVVALYRFPTRSVIPLALFLSGVLTFLGTGLAGLSVIPRYLLVPSVMWSLFAAVLVAGFTMIRRGERLHGYWAWGATAIVLVGLAYTAVYPPLPTRLNNELVFRGSSHESLRRILDQPAVEDGLRCGPLSVPTHKLIPDVRWVLDLPESEVLARSDDSSSVQRRVRYGVALFPVGRTNVLRTGFAVSTDAIAQVPARGFTKVADDRYFAAYVRCPPGHA